MFFSLFNHLDSPNGGETWQRGTTHTIQWHYMGCPGSNVKIELIRNVAGALPITSTIINNTPIGINGNGSYNWPIPANNATGTNVFKVKVTTDLGYSDTTNSFFTISATP